MKIIKIIFYLCMSLLLIGCKRSPPTLSIETPLTGEYIYRHQDEKMIVIKEDLESKKKPYYPWEEENLSHFPKITKDFFRCKGSYLNPVKLVQKEKEIVRYYDCGGPQKHSLILRDGKEFIYPVLIDLLNYVQNQTGKRVVITCGYCCPEHYAYLDHIKPTSKHTVGAEVDFYIQGLEFQPEKVIELILRYYKETEKYKGLKEYEDFHRYEKLDTDVSILPWYNKEIFIKLTKKHERRDFDNRHCYPYLTIQVRYDMDLKERVNYDWDKAFKHFHRW